MSGLDSAEFLARSPANSSGTDRASQDCGSDNKKLRRREKNRIAAQRSRKKQTLKADKLHEEYEGLEQENTALKREIRKLSEEVKHLSDALKDHERICPIIHCTMNFATAPRPHPNVIASCLSREGQSGVS
ncbi:basic leucine zipper transcriptional factor ATF-like 3 [Pristis pectinata]|uniref:basic leucine zipper transcriptional factor ATF-like 3 n=1 Tax=Pristis pectinata TaxID=685728 RepID=UPI00223D0F7F|nr:basic leucine zipper transcriptional factor ATF-like 3 [Pristis pectinata]XP_051868094.1 basic leucine zipper transcriptional factor ATF-like 3 [Pristis pectinata]